MTLPMEVRIIQGVKRFYGNDAVSLLETYSLLSKQGKKKVISYIDDISKSYPSEESI